MIQRRTDVRLSPTSIEMTALLVRRVLILCGGVRGQWGRTAELGENLQSAGTCDKEELHNPTGQPSAFLVWEVSHLLPSDGKRGPCAPMQYTGMPQFCVVKYGASPLMIWMLVPKHILGKQG